MTAQERYNIALNIISRVGIDGDLMGEYGKAMAQINRYNTMQDMQPVISPELPSPVTPQSTQMSPEVQTPMTEMQGQNGVPVM